MPKILVLGGGICGLATGLLLARDGHEVTLLERDPDPVPGSLDEAWERWERDGVTQFRLAHYLHARGSGIISDELPDVRDALLDAGAAVVEPLKRMPPQIADGPRPGDERLATFTARRTTLEHAFARAAEEQAGLTVRRGASAVRLVTRDGGAVPHVTGVETDAGERLSADLVVDAMGRRSVLPKWLEQAGCDPAVEEAEDCGFIYYGRFFRSSDGSLPEVMAPLLSPIGSISILTLPSDNGTWSVTVSIASADQPLKRLRDEDAWTAVISSYPLHAHWLDGEPITGMVAMGGVIDRYRRFARGGRPVATGVAAVADAWACTNPSLGRGITFGLAHAVRLRDTVRSHIERPQEFAEAWDEVTERELTPWYRATVTADRARIAEAEALKNGLEPPPPKDFAAALSDALPAAMTQDADVFRAGLEIIGCFSLPEEVFARPGMAERVIELAERVPERRFPGPDREQLLRILADPVAAVRT